MYQRCGGSRTRQQQSTPAAEQQPGFPTAVNHDALEFILLKSRKESKVHYCHPFIFLRCPYVYESLHGIQAYRDSHTIDITRRSVEPSSSGDTGL
jgi:hypothetical protein